MSGIESGGGERPMQIMSDRHVAEGMINSTVDALDTDVERRQQDDVVQVSQAGRACERRQKPWTDDALNDDEADVAESPSSSPGCLDDYGVLAVGLR